jgi:hypothetical protein
MKIAYLILAHNNYVHLQRLVNALNDRDVTFFIHIDDTLALPDTLNKFDNIIFIRGPKVYWAGWSTVEAILALVRNATSIGFDYYLLLSGVDYPIRPNSFLYKILSSGGEYIGINDGFSFHKPENRIKYYYFDGFERKNRRRVKTIFFTILERSMRLFFQKKSHPFKKIYYGPTWWALSHDCLLFVLNQIDTNGKYKRFYKTSWDPDESIFQTIIGNSPIFSTCKPNLTYADWSSERPYKASPPLINRNHIELFKKNIKFNSAFGTYTPFFARKFDDSSEHIIGLIEKELRNNDSAEILI